MCKNNLEGVGKQNQHYFKLFVNPFFLFHVRKFINVVFDKIIFEPHHNNVICVSLSYDYLFGRLIILMGNLFENDICGFVYIL